MNKLTPALAVAAAVLFAAASPAAFAQTNLPKPGTGASEQRIVVLAPIDEHKKRPKKPKKSKKAMDAASTPAS